MAQKLSRRADADDPPLVEPGDLAPQLERLVVLGVDRGQEPVPGQAVFLGDQVPGELDRQRLEVVAEAEIAQHLEEGVMPGGVADIVQVVVLAAGAHAFLRGDRPVVGPLLDAGEDVLELHHAGIGEQQGRVVVRHQRRGGHDLVAVPAEIVEEGRADLVGGRHGSTVRRPRPRDQAAGSLVVADGAKCGRDIRRANRVRQRSGNCLAAPTVPGEERLVVADVVAQEFISGSRAAH